MYRKVGRNGTAIEPLGLGHVVVIGLVVTNLIGGSGMLWFVASGCKIPCESPESIAATNAAAQTFLLTLVLSASMPSLRSSVLTSRPALLAMTLISVGTFVALFPSSG
jgi:hypothetical protein